MTIQVERLAACPVCGATRLREGWRMPDFESGTGEYGLTECLACGVAFTSPRPVEASLPELYAGRTTADFPRTGEGLAERLRRFAVDRYARQQLRGFDPGPGARVALLDFGCGDGTLACALRRHALRQGWEAEITAVDFEESPPPRLANAEGIRYLSQARWGGERRRYDAVFLRHVVEHHPAPGRLLEELKGVLNPGALLCIEVPNRRSAWARIFGRHYSGWYVPRHLVHFDPRSLAALFSAHGYRCRALRLAHTPLLGRSLGYRLGKPIDNLGLLGLASYPLQVAVDLLTRRSSTLRVVAVAHDA